MNAKKGSTYTAGIIKKAGEWWGHFLMRRSRVGTEKHMDNLRSLWTCRPKPSTFLTWAFLLHDPRGRGGAGWGVEGPGWGRAGPEVEGGGVEGGGEQGRSSTEAPGTGAGTTPPVPAQGRGAWFPLCCESRPGFDQ